MLLLHECVLEELLLLRCLVRFLPFEVSGRGTASELTSWLIPSVQRIPDIVVLFTLIQTLSACSPDEHVVVDVASRDPLRVVSAVDFSQVLDVRVEVAQVVVAAQALQGVAASTRPR